MSSLSAVAALLALCTALLFTLSWADEPPRQPTSPAPASSRVLPGVQTNGAVLLPNSWSLRPAGKQLGLGDFPVNAALHPSGQWLAVLHAGYGDHEIVIVDLNPNHHRIVNRVVVDQTFYGLCFSPDGRKLFASGGEYEVVHAFDFKRGLLGNHEELRVAKESDKFVVAGLAVDAKGRTLFAAGPWGDAVAILPLDNPDNRTTVTVEKNSYPYTCLPEPGGKRLFVSLWNAASVAVIDLETRKVSETWKTEPHPTEMVLAPDRKTLFVACANSTRVSVLDTDKGTSLETIGCALYPTVPLGNTPNSLSLTPDGQMLFVANADSNNLSVFTVAERGKAKPLGFIPTGWYPTSVRYNPADRKLYVANGKGGGSKANRHGPNPFRASPTFEYIAQLMRGTLSTIDLPTPEKMAEHTKTAYACSPLLRDLGVTVTPSEGNPIPKAVGEKSPIKYVLYIIKENRTYDQVLGDVKEGNGDPTLCIFPEKVTPNHHKIAREFVLLDNFYVDGEVSADGHEWSMGAYATDFVEKLWPLNYRGSPLKKIGYPAEGAYAIAPPAGGYIWDRCAEAKVSYRSYGEFIRNANPEKKEPAKALVKGLEGHFDPEFHGYDLDYPDQKRADRFLSELARFEKEGDLPCLQILRLPNDHTYGTRPDKLTPTALVADNDLAFGRVIEAVTKSKFWPEMAVFVIEDDAQNGPDHVDAHRTIAFVASPYVKRGSVDSTMYSTSSLLRTMELILGLKPMTQFDAAAKPMYNAFQGKADIKGYKHVVPDVDRTEKNKKTAWGAEESKKMNFAKEDAADDLLLNEVVWRSVKGPGSKMPAPVRAAFVVPHAKHEEEDDDD